jgi:glyoxylase-like metal-dependent hydrolase (beta-lactamase superfamily II)
LRLKQVDAVIISHMHGDHCVDAPYLREKWGAKIWTHERVAPKIETPERYDYVAPVQAYGPKLDRVTCDGVFKDGETVEWEGYKFTFDWMPGQTEFHCCTHGVIDGMLMAFTGDNIFGNPADPRQNGHECVTARNSAIFEEGYIYAGEYLQRLNPDMLIGAHGWVMPNPKAFIERYLESAIKVRDAYRGLSSTDDYRLMFDPYWVRAEPYRMKAKPGETVDVQVFVRNFRSRAQKHRILVQTPPGVTATPGKFEGSLPAETTKSFPLRLSISAEVKPQVQIIAFDATLDDHRYGPWFDMIVDCGA